MKKYYLHNGIEQQGPFDIDDLKIKDINKCTPIWYDGLPEWTTAEKVDDLKELIKTSTPPPFVPKQPTPPPFVAKQPTPLPINKPKTEQTKVWSPPKQKTKFNIWWLLLILVGVIFLVIIISYSLNRPGGSIGSSSYQKKVMTVEEIEKADPAKFLEASGTYAPAFWDENVFTLTGTVKNNATVANYKDVVIEVKFLSSTETELSSQQYVLYEFVPAHSEKLFLWKIEKKEGCEKLGLYVISAVPY